MHITHDWHWYTELLHLRETHYVRFTAVHKGLRQRGLALRTERNEQSRKPGT